MISYSCKPGKWVWGLIPLALPFLGAWVLNTPIMVGKLSQQASQSLKSAGFDEISVTMAGRDVVLAGQAESRQAIDRAVQAVTGIYGIRRADYGAVKIVKPVVLGSPTVIPADGNNAQPAIKGRWPEGIATTLTVKVGDKSYVLGQNDELVSDGKGNWTLKLSSPLADGRYDIAVSITDGKKATATDNSKDEVLIDTTPPAAPAIATKLVTRKTRPAISGTWAAKDAESLSVSLAGKTYILGKNKVLSVDGKGNWTLIPPMDLADGVYDVTVKTADKPGNVSTTTASAALTIDTTAPAAGSVQVSRGASLTPVIKGKWSKAAGNRLVVALAGKNYTLGKDKALSSDENGNWTLKLAKPLAAGTYGITVTSADGLGNEGSMTLPGAVIIDTTAPATPAVTSFENTAAGPVFKGTWAEKTGNTLKVVVAGKIFAFGRDKQLTSDGKGNWTLSLSEPLDDGKYAVLAESSDEFGNLARTEKPPVISVDNTRPDQPTVNKLASRSRMPTITGSWPQSDQNSLSVDLAGQSYAFGKDPQLTSDDKGNWSLTPAQELADGSYDVVVTVSDQAGNKSVAQGSKALVIDATPPQIPTVTTVLTRNRLPAITGTWDSSDAVGLSVSVAGQSFSNARAGEIEINGDHWSVIPRTAIADGSYDVMAVVTDELGNASRDAGRDELVIDGTSPPTPTVRPVFGTNKRPLVSGTWPQDGQNSLSVRLAGKAYSLTKTGPLTSDGKGNWKLALQEDLQPGSYDVKVKVADRLGNQSNDASSGEIWIKPEQKLAAPDVSGETSRGTGTPSGRAVETCQKDFIAVLAGQSIAFKFNKLEINAASQALLDRLAKIAKACPSAKIEVAGHTDWRGSASFNQSLSEGRASAVVDALVARGVAKSRLRALGYGETRPIADNNSKQGRAKNRRIEIKVVQ